MPAVGVGERGGLMWPFVLLSRHPLRLLVTGSFDSEGRGRIGLLCLLQHNDGSALTLLLPVRLQPSIFGLVQGHQPHRCQAEVPISFAGLDRCTSLRAQPALSAVGKLVDGAFGRSETAACYIFHYVRGRLYKQLSAKIQSDEKNDTV